MEQLYNQYLAQDFGRKMISSFIWDIHYPV